MRWLDRGVVAAAHLLGAFAFVGPLLLGAADAGASPHAADAPWLFTVLGGLLVGIALVDLRTGRMDAKQVALLGVLCALNATLRLPGSFGGASLMFVLPILGGRTFGARFGFLLGSLSMASSGLLTGGVGPWLPFQMWALGWVGAGAGLLPMRARATRSAVLMLAAYGWVAGFVFGAVMNLWSWPFTTGDSAIAWQPGLTLAETAQRYWRFYLVTSLAWDAGRAIANAVLLGIAGAPLLRVMTRYRDRLGPTWDAPASAPARAG